MKFLFYILFFIPLIFISSQLSAQCTGTSCTTSSNAANGNITIATGETLCLTRNGSFSGDITFSAGSQLCVSPNTTIVNGVNINISGTGVIIQNYGTWNKDLNLGNNNSTFNNFGTFSVGSLTVGNGNTFTSTTNVTVTGTTKAENNSTISITGNFSTGNYEGDNNSTLTVSGNLNAVNITTSGSMVIGGTTSAVNVTTNNNGSIVFGSGATVAGTVDNNGNMQFNGDATIGGSFANKGDLVINNSTISVGGAFGNDRNIVAQGSCGRINIAGSSTNNSSGNVGVDGSNIDICDGSSTSGGGFDTPDGNEGANVSNCTCVPTILPITLTSFTAKKESNTIIHIDWQTIFELENEFFEIERSFSGTDFIIITQMAAQKDNQESHSERNYSFIDNLNDVNLNLNLSNKTIYYRLKQVDTNGDFSYSPVVGVHIDKQNNEEIKLISFQNEWKIESQNSVQVKVYSSIGILQGTYYLNQNQSTIPVFNLAKGMYILHIQDKKTNKMTILKTIR